MLLVVTSVLLVTSLILPTLCDVTGTNPVNSACLCVTSPNVPILDYGCGFYTIGVASDGQCFRYSAGKLNCTVEASYREFFRIDYTLDKSGWVDGVYLQEVPDSNCGPVPDELQIIVLGDWGEILLRGQDWVAEGMAAWSTLNKPARIITTGDNIYPEGIDSWDDPQMDIKWRNVYDQESIRNLTWYVSVGNHDFGTWSGEEWNQVELSKHDPQWYLPHLWYDYVDQVGDKTVHFIVFDTESFGHGINNYTDMMDWFETTLRESTADWKLVIGHRHVFSVGDVLNDKGAVTDNLYGYLVPLMERYGVDAYVCGHDHNLQHIKNITGLGIDYVISGAGGALLSRYIADNAEYLRTVYGVEAVFFDMVYGFVTLTVRPTQLIFDFYDYDAQLLYTFIRTPDQQRQQQGR